MRFWCDEGDVIVCKVEGSDWLIGRDNNGNGTDVGESEKKLGMAGVARGMVDDLKTWTVE